MHNISMYRVNKMFTSEYKKIGLNLLLERRRRGLSQEQLSDLSGVSRARISDMERGKETFKLDTLMMLAKAMDMDYQELLK